MSYTSFVYDIPEAEDQSTSICIKKPDAAPQAVIGTCAYYKFRMGNFMARHNDCLHEPPDYYYGPMKTAQALKLEHLKELQKQQLLDNFSSAHLMPAGVAPINGNDWKELLFTDEMKKRGETEITYMRGGMLKYFVPAQSYGYKYCVKFTDELMPKLTPDGQYWLKQAKLNLQLFMEQGVIRRYYISDYNKSYNIENGLTQKDGKTPIDKTGKIVQRFYTDIELRNTKFQSFAFATHPDAYDPKKMSFLSAQDLIRILLTPDFKEWLGAETWDQAWVMAKNMDYDRVAKATWEQLKKDTKEIIEKANDSLRETEKKVDESLNKAAKNLKQYWDELFN